jgi:hypothetical protein
MIYIPVVASSSRRYSQGCLLLVLSREGTHSGWIPQLEFGKALEVLTEDGFTKNGPKSSSRDRTKKVNRIVLFSSFLLIKRYSQGCLL